MDADLVRYPTGTAQGLLGHRADPASGRQVLGQAPPRRPVELQVLPRAYHRRTYAQEAHTEGEGRAKARQRTREQSRQEGGDVQPQPPLLSNARYVHLTKARQRRCGG